MQIKDYFNKINNYLKKISNYLKQNKLKINILLVISIILIGLIIINVDESSLNSLFINYEDSLVINEVNTHKEDKKEDTTITTSDNNNQTVEKNKATFVNNVANLNNWTFPVAGNYAITTYYSYSHKAIDIYSYNGYGANILAANNGTVITVNNSDSDKLTISAGDNVDLNEYITAVDYLGRPITVEITGDYDLTTSGTYIITAIATDRFGNVSEKEITLVVEKSDDSSDSDGVSKAYKFKATITNSEGKVVAGEKFNLYKIEVKKRWFRADSENLIYISTLESNEEGEIYAELEEAGKYVLKQVNSATGNEVTGSEVTIELTEDNKGNVITIPDIVINDATSGDSGSNGNNGSNDDNGNNGDSGTDDSGSGDIGTGDSDSGNPGDNGNTDNSNKPEVPVNPEDPDSSDNSNNGVTNDDKITEENKNDLPKTGQGIFYGVTIAVAVIVIGSGVYLVAKKKK